MATLPLDVIQKELITIIAKSLEIPEKTIHLTSSLINDLEAESIDIMDIRFAIEQKFGFKFNLEEIKNFAHTGGGRTEIDRERHPCTVHGR